jgi:hypothetical protein
VCCSANQHCGTHSLLQQANHAQTDTGYLNIYHVHSSQAPAVSVAGVGARKPTRDTIYLQHTVPIHSESPPCCITGDSKQLLLGCQDSSIHLVTWTGKVQLR